MAAAAKTVTIDEIPEAQIIRLRLNQAANEPLPVRANPGFLSHVRAYARNFFEAEAVELEPSADAETTKRNRERIRHSFAQMRRKLESQEELVVEQIGGMSIGQQETVLSFWEGVATFLTDIIYHLGKLWSAVVEKIKEGYQLIVGSIKSFFDTLTQAIKQIFSSNSLQSPPPCNDHME